MTDSKNKLFLLGILILALLIRIWGIDYGLSYFFVADEQSIVAGSLKMAQLKTLLPVFHPDEFRLLYYPPLMSYIYLFFLAPLILIKYLIGSWPSLAELQDFLTLNPGFIWLIARIITVLMAVASIYLIYLIGKKIFNQRVGLLAGLFLSLSFFHSQFSHFARHWLPAVFFIYLTIWLALNIKENQKKYYLMTGLAAGLGFGVSYITAVVLFLVLLIHGQKIKDKNLWLMLIVFVIVASIFVLLHPQEFFRVLIGEDSTLAQAKSLTNWLSSFVYYLKTLFFFELVVLIFALLGWLILWFESRKLWFISLFWPIIYISVLYYFFHNEARYIILIIPWLCLLAGYGFYSIIKNIHSRLVIGLVILLIFVYPLLIVSKYDYLLNQKDTRILAKEWIEDNIPTDNKFITDWRGIKLIPQKGALLLQQKIDPDSLRSDDRVLLSLDEEKYPQPAFDVLPLHFIGEKLPKDLTQYIKENEYKYFIVQYWQKEELTEQDQSIIKQGQLIKKFSPDSMNYSIDTNGNFLEPISIIFSFERLGPIIEIWELNSQISFTKL